VSPPTANVETIRKYIKDGRKASNIIFYWDSNSRLKDLERAVERTRGSLKAKGKLYKMPSIYYISEDSFLTELI